MLWGIAILKGPFDRGAVLLLLVVMLFSAMGVAGCAASGTPPPAGAATRSAGRLIGRWAGETNIVVNWTQARTLPVQLDIQSDGSVSGKVGDAQLKEGILGNTHPFGLVFGVPEGPRGKPPGSLAADDHFQVTAKLDGPLIAAEQVRRGGVIVAFSLAQDQTLRGGLTSTGSEFGGKDSMKLSGRTMVLCRQP
jgi:hypothetical protein